eukprot:6207517-Pleurochrysis_carterae.AAC.2
MGTTLGLLKAARAQPRAIIIELRAELCGCFGQVGRNFDIICYRCWGSRYVRFQRDMCLGSCPARHRVLSTRLSSCRGISFCLPCFCALQGANLSPAAILAMGISNVLADALSMGA